jgi:hypothetical protein
MHAAPWTTIIEFNAEESREDNDWQRDLRRSRGAPN